ncbi:hypothetical protein PIB30_091619 [Stylosanthes scabra]|uniref:Uncharacterized protein n=1 Tax=Stylosanthes scabra TaxID=79078 RepID=A0ABU6XUX4_9FABA|nr:hypothetical protein [Stylosanthes scabra]
MKPYPPFIVGLNHINTHPIDSSTGRQRLSFAVESVVLAGSVIHICQEPRVSTVDGSECAQPPRLSVFLTPLNHPAYSRRHCYTSLIC